MNEELRRTPLYEAHQALGARMTSFGGWEMPVNYPAGIIREHLHTRKGVSLFDTCHMDELQAAGAAAARGLELVLARRVDDQPVGSCRYNMLVADDGGILDDLIVYRLAAEDFLLVVNAGKGDEDLAFMRQRVPADVHLGDLSSETGKLDLQGPESAKVLGELGIRLGELPGYFRWKTMDVGGHSVLISRTGYTGELGFELYFPADQAPDLWHLLLGQPGVEAAGLGARDTLRLEAALPLYGHELRPEVNPLEAGFGGMLERGATERLAGMKLGVRRVLVGLALEDRRAARAGAVVRACDGEVIGEVTSGSYAPSLGYAIALALIRGAGYEEEGIPVRVGGGEKALDAATVNLPFFREGSVRKKLQGV